MSAKKTLGLTVKSIVAIVFLGMNPSAQNAIPELKCSYVDEWVSDLCTSVWPVCSGHCSTTGFPFGEVPCGGCVDWPDTSCTELVSWHIQIDLLQTTCSYQYISSENRQGNAACSCRRLPLKQAVETLGFALNACVNR